MTIVHTIVITALKQKHSSQANLCNFGEHRTLKIYILLCTLIYLLNLKENTLDIASFCPVLL